MRVRLGTLLRKLVARPWLLAATIVLGIATTAVTGYYSYRTYDFVQHDNDFCLSCHLMEEPFERFAQSVHRELGCKACHQPTLVGRSQMAITQIVEQPEELSAHAEVPNERCADCHVDGDPDQWETVQNSAGHKAHLESQDSTLVGLQCVECHSTSLHEFAATDQTCGQSDCHDNSELQLGEMGQFTVHCTACHEFNATVPENVGDQAVARGDGDTLDDSTRIGGGLSPALEALRPNEGTCFTCHAMRTLVQLPEDDPHRADCAACHNPHEQTEAAQAGETCAGAGCHTDSEELTGFHEGLATGVLEDCNACHTAHDFHVKGSDCTACHTEVLQDGPPPASRGVASAASPRAQPAALRSAPLDAAAAPVRVAGLGVSYLHGVVVRQVQASTSDSTFYHSQHVDVDCLSCHTEEGTHGELTVTTQADCRSCHHDEPVVEQCAACHQSAEFPGEALQRIHTMQLDVRDPFERSLPFLHSDHEDRECAECHTEEVTLDSAGESCSACHEEHHEPEMACRSCHEEAPVEDHPAEVHVGCSGAGCHEPTPFDLIPSTQEFCLACHQEYTDHKLDSDQGCAECHALPEPLIGRGVGP